MDVDNAEEPIYQYYAIVNDQEELEDEDKSVIYLTFGQNESEEETVSSQTAILANTDDEETATIDIPNFKVISLTDGQIYVAENVAEENLTAVQPELVCKEESLIPTKDTTQESEETDGSEEFQEIKLEDGTCAIIDKKLLNSLLENANAKTQENKKRKKFPCMYFGCDKIYSTAQHLTVHIRSHTGVRPYQCTVEGCNKSFAKGYSLKAHLRIHTGEKPYACNICTKQFKTSGDLQKHVRTHTGEKPFRCPIDGCGRSFTTSNIRKVHIRSHTGERPYVCQKPMCGKAFASATNYKNHMRIHSGEKPYVCSVPGCDKRFTEYSSLYKHNMVHKPYKPFKCNYCGQLCKQENTLKAHKRSIHGVVITPDGTEIMIKKQDYQEVMYEITEGRKSKIIVELEEDEDDE
ncbi:zinc finger protein [Oryctes borbonicus]|uniref:Zinc finger protein n=1 Tax=Oryctes borbonicus TaxID=1629725 RepID=A0A0T6BDT6_9SCAR|nr:zinc finger protein [Oryctes borbonicus]